MTAFLSIAIKVLGSKSLTRQTISYGIVILAFCCVGSSSILAQTSNLLLNGITIRSGFTLNFSETVLILTDSSTIILGPDIHSVTFAESDEEIWTSSTLTITGWTGTAGSSGTAGRLFVGTDSSGLTTAQLAKISFTGYAGAASILSTGEVVPVAAGPSESVISNVSGSSDICAGSIAIIRIAITGGTSPYTIVYSDGSSNFTVNNYLSGADIQVTPDSNTTYTLVSVTDNNNLPGADNSGSAIITVSNSVVPTSTGTYTATLHHTDGAILNYIDVSCNLLAGIEDTVGGTVLGITTVTTALLTAPPLPQMANSQTFGPRYHSITPTSGGLGNITFYYLQSDFTTYNGSNGTLDMPTSGNNSDPNIGNIRIAQIDTGDSLSTTLSYTPSLVNYNSDESYWEVTVSNVMLPSTGSEFYFYGEANCDLVIDYNSIAIDDISSTSALVSWDAVIGATGYVVRWRTGAGTWNAAVSMQTSINLAPLNSGSNYEVQLRVICNGGYGLNSNSVGFTTLTPLATCVSPTGLAATGITTNGAVIVWDAVVNNVVSYTLRWRVSPAGTWSQATITTTSRNLKPWLLAGTTYDLQVRTNCTGAQTDQSVWSSMVQFTTNSPLPACEIPTGLAATGITLNGAVIVWNAVANNVVSYTLRWRLSPAGAWNQATTNTTSRNLSPWLLSGTTYDLQVRTNCSGTQTNQSDWSPIVQFTTHLPLPVCAAPTGLSATEITTKGALMVWDSVDNNAVSYTFRWRVASPVGAWNQATTNMTFRNLNPWLLSATTYDAQVRTNCSGAQTNQSDWSSILQFTTDTIPCSLPPANVVVNDISDNSAYVSWDSVPDYASFQVRYKLVNEQSWDTVSTVHLNALLNGLFSESEYEVQVKTICNNVYPGVSSDWSNSITFNTISAGFSERTYIAYRGSDGILARTDIRIFPNPTTDILHLTFDSPQPERLNIRFVDVSGRLVHEVEHTTSKGYNSMQIHLAYLQHGVYMMQMYSPDRWIYTGRVIKTD